MSPTLDQTVAAMLGQLAVHLPVPVPALPPPNVTVVRLKEKLAGLGQRLGTETRGSTPVALKASRIDSEVRFQLWGATSEAVDDDILALQTGLLQAEDALRAAGFLQLATVGTTLAEPIAPLNGWRKTTSFEVLFEHRFEDQDGAESLITRIPVTGDLEAPGSSGRETTVVSGTLGRWDNEAAPPLVATGVGTASTLAALAFLPPGPSPAGSVTVLRTFDGAAGPPLAHPDLASFVAATGGHEPAERHARVIFPSIPAFLAELAPLGAAVEMGDWNLDAVPDDYEPRSLDLAPAIELPEAGDRLEVLHAAPAGLDRPAVVYLRFN